MTFELTAATLRRLCDLNGFEVPSSGLVFFGLRSALPADEADGSFERRSWIDLATVDHLHPRCVLGQWRPASDELCVFPGSTVPHRRYVATAKQRAGQGANQLMTGRYPDYRKGMHCATRPTGHRAFRQTRAQAVRRTADDFDYDGDDRVEIGNPYDNIHAAWSPGPEHDRFASAGCQVIVGYPSCRKRDDAPAVGPWRRFSDNAYRSKQKSFVYLLWNARDARRVVAASGAPAYPRARFGSAGARVARVQRALRKRSLYEGRVDGDFGPRTLRAVLAFQAATFGADGADGVVGPVTAEALRARWGCV